MLFAKLRCAHHVCLLADQATSMARPPVGCRLSFLGMLTCSTCVAQEQQGHCDRYEACRARVGSSHCCKAEALLGRSPRPRTWLAARRSCRHCKEQAELSSNGDLGRWCISLPIEATSEHPPAGHSQAQGSAPLYCTRFLPRPTPPHSLFRHAQVAVAECGHSLRSMVNALLILILLLAL